MPDLEDIRALTFDVFGTIVDWRSGVAAEARRIGDSLGVDADWFRLADAWRALYVPYMNRVRLGELPWTNFDALHRMSLDQVLDELHIEGFDSAARDELTRAWERLPAWPDALPGLSALGERFTVATLSNGNRSQQDAHDGRRSQGGSARRSRRRPPHDLRRAAAGEGTLRRR